MPNKNFSTTNKVPANKNKVFYQELVDQLLKLTTAGFGLAAALAWNDTVKTAIDQYIKPYTMVNSVFISQIIYALIVTLLAVAVTYQLTKLNQKFSNKK